MIKRFTVIFLVLAYSHTGFSYAQSPKLDFQITERDKPKDCPAGGMNLIEGVLSGADLDTYVDVILYIQKYDRTWVKRTFRRKGSGVIRLNESDCNYTGNYYAFACEVGNCDKMPSGEQVALRHSKKDDKVKFRITERRTINECQNQSKGIAFVKGEVYTPYGEQTVVTLFLQKKDNTWRKKTYRYVGSGEVPINIYDCDLNGQYRILISKK